MFCVFKARYFPMVEFLEARVTSNSSYVWRSISALRPVLLKGASVANG